MDASHRADVFNSLNYGINSGWKFNWLSFAEIVYIFFLAFKMNNLRRHG